MEEGIQDYKKPKQFRWAFWWGLGIVAACIAWMLVEEFFFDNNHDGAAPMTNLLYEIMYKFGIWPIILYIGVGAPLLEECSFRLWGNGKSWTGYTSVVLMTLFCLTVSWPMALAALVAGVGIMIVLNGDRSKRLFYLMMLSSLLFAVAHIDNYSAHWFNLSVALLHKFGMGLLASYLVINHNLLWAIVFHMLNNSILAIPMGIVFTHLQEETTMVNGDGWRMEMQPVLTDNGDRSRPTLQWNGDTLVLVNSPGKTAYLLATIDKFTYNGDITFHHDASCHPLISTTIVFSDSRRDYDDIIYQMYEQGWISVDTVVTTVLPNDYFSDTLKHLNLTFHSAYDPLNRL